jgi:type II secretory pathway component GspD/PulD (secretin)
MDMMRGALGPFLISISLVAAAQQSLEVISLRYRTVDQVLDTLRPLVEPGGTLTGQGSQLILRVSPANLAEIRRALDAIDRPQRRLQISVRFDDALESSRRDLAVGGSASNQGVRIEGSARDSQRTAEERVDQRVQTIDGGRATISTGQSRPVRRRETVHTPKGLVTLEVTEIRETASGFEVVPRVSGNMVSMQIFTPRAASTVSGRLGEWLELGAIDGSAARDERGIGSLSEATATQSRRVSVKVEALD